MPARPPHRGLQQPLSPPDGEEPSASAELHFAKIPVVGEHPATFSAQQEISASNPANRVITMLRRAGLGAVLRIAVPSGDASQMLTTIERIIITLTWALTVTSTLAIAIAASLSASVVLAIIVTELTGFVITLLATRWRRHKKELDLTAASGRRPRNLLAPAAFAGMPHRKAREGTRSAATCRAAGAARHLAGRTGRP